VILFLDDDAERRRRFLSRNPTALVYESARGTIRRLSADEHWSLVSLDHDLGGEVMADSAGPDTGMEVVRWIVANRPIIDRIICHTFNPVAGPAMVTALREAGYDAAWEPFRVES